MCGIPKLTHSNRNPSEILCLWHFVCVTVPLMNFGVCDTYSFLHWKEGTERVPQFSLLPRFELNFYILHPLPYQAKKYFSVLDIWPCSKCIVVSWCYAADRVYCILLLLFYRTYVHKRVLKLMRRRHYFVAFTFYALVRSCKYNIVNWYDIAIVKLFRFTSIYIWPRKLTVWTLWPSFIQATKTSYTNTILFQHLDN